MKKLAVFAILSIVAVSQAVTVPVRPAGALPRRGILPSDRPWLVLLPEEKTPCEYSVYDMEGNLVAGPYTISRFAVPNPVPWSAENPVCYTLEIKRGDSVEKKVFGFCVKTIRRGVLYINSRPVRVRFAPKELNGNAEFSSRISEEDAFLKGIYRLDGAEACDIIHEVACPAPEATFHRFRDWTVSATNYFSRIVVANRNAFTGSAGVELSWALLKDGSQRDGGTISLGAIGPREEAVFDMPTVVEEERFGGGTVSVRFEFAKEGCVISREQIDVVESRSAKQICPPRGFFGSLFGGSRAMDSAADGVRVLSASGMSLSFPDSSAFPGSFAETGFGGGTLFLDMRLVNDIVDLDDRPFVLPRPPDEERRGSVSIRACSLHPYGFSGAKRATVASKWTLYPNGIAAFRGRIVQGDLQGRCGFSLAVPCPAPSRDWRKAWFGKRPFGENMKVEWFGLGPRDNTPDDSEGAFLGRWTKDATSFARASSVRAFRAGPLVVRALDAPFSFEFAPDSDSASATLILYPARDESKDSLVFGFAFSGDGELEALSPDDSLDIPDVR